MTSSVRPENKRSRSRPNLIKAFTNQNNKQPPSINPPVLQALPYGSSAPGQQPTKSWRVRSNTTSNLLQPASGRLAEAKLNIDAASDAMGLGKLTDAKRGRSESPTKSRTLRSSKSISNLASLFSKSKGKDSDPVFALGENKENRSPTRPPKTGSIKSSQRDRPTTSVYGSAEAERVNNIERRAPGIQYTRAQGSEGQLRSTAEVKSHLEGGPSNRQSLHPKHGESNPPTAFTNGFDDSKNWARPPSSTSAQEFARCGGAVANKEHHIGARSRTNDQDRKISETSIGTKRSSRVMATVAMYNEKTKAAEDRLSLKGKDLQTAFEAVSRNVPESMRPNMRSLDDRIKAEFIKNDSMDFTNVGDDSGDARRPPTSQSRSSVEDSTVQTSNQGSLERGRKPGDSVERDSSNNDLTETPSKRSRSRSRGFTLGKGDRSPSKRPRSTSRPRSIMNFKNLSSTSVMTLGTLDGASDSKDKSAAFTRPDDFIQYLRTQTKPEAVEVGKMHKLRLLLRNETISWVHTFILNGGMRHVMELLKSIMQMEWREEHEDLLLHEVLLCMRGLCTTERALIELSEVRSSLFPELLKMLFDEEKKGPSEYNTRGIIVSLLFSYLSSAPPAEQDRRAQSLLEDLSDARLTDKESPIAFMLEMHQRRPYQTWCKELSNVTKEVFWIFLHHVNIVPLVSLTAELDRETFRQRYFPRDRAPVPAAPYVGGVEWDATMYLAGHLDLLNGLVASLPTRAARNTVRGEIRASGFERLMGGTLRLCKEKFYGAVHEGLKTWVAAAVEDGWPVEDVRLGPPREESRSPVKRSGKKSKPPQLELPKLDLDLQTDSRAEAREDDGWI